MATVPRNYRGRETHFTGTGEQEPGPNALCKAEHVHGPQEACLDGLDGIVPEEQCSWVTSD